MEENQQDEIQENVSFSSLRKKTQLILMRLMKEAQGFKNLTSKPESRPVARLFSVKEAETMIGRTRPTIKKMEEKLLNEENNLLPLAIHANGRTAGYTFSWIQALRKEAGTLPWRNPETDDPFTLSVIQFKGGAGKTETVSNLSRYLALKGYRILVLDLDHQGSCTSSFGYFPDMTFSEKDTVIPYLKAEKDSLDYSIRKTAWPNIDLIPGCMALEDFNWTMAQYALSIAKNEKDVSAEELKLQQRDLIYELKRGIETVSHNYDIVLIDSPPSSSIISFEIIAATDGVIIPVPPRKHDLASTEQFLGIAERLTQKGGDDKVEGELSDKEFKFLRFLVTQYTNDGNRSSNDADFFRFCKTIYGDNCYDRVFRMISNIKEASRNFTTVYEVKKPNKAILQELDSVFEQVEHDIIKHWPSKRNALMKEAIGG